MKLNHPHLNGSRFLIAGAGGGFDIFGGLPLAFELLNQRNDNVVLANYSVRASSTEYLYRESTDEDYPEGALSKTGLKVYTFPKLGVQLLKKAYEEIIKLHNIDCVILADGGVDSLMHGNEAEAGTFFEDSISLAAVSALDVPHKYLMCIGFGTEIEENLNHYRVLENIAKFAQQGGFLGTCSLTKEMESYKFYKQACLAAWQDKRKSHIHTRIIPSIEGEFGDFKMYEEIDAHVTSASNNKPFVSPLSSIMWFFDLNTVAKNNLYVTKLTPSGTFIDARMILRSQMIPPTRDKQVIPL